MPSKNSINRPKNRNQAQSKARHLSRSRKQNTVIEYGKVDSKKVAQKKARRKALASKVDTDQIMEDIQTEEKKEEVRKSSVGTTIGGPATTI